MPSLNTFVFELCCRQTNKQTNSVLSLLSTPTNTVGEGNKYAAAVKSFRQMYHMLRQTW